MENKYYTPNIEDIFIGYECEMFMSKKWQKHIYNKNDFESIHIDMDGRWVRTKYLSKEDILAEGWDILTDNKSNYGFIKGKSLCYFWKGSIPYIEIYPEEGYDTQYQGECLSINEFRKISKWLKI